VIPYAPRRGFLPFHDRTQRWAVLVCHRRAGKTVACINDLVRSAVMCRLDAPRFAYIAPLFRQGKDIAWDYLKRFTAPIPGVTHNEAELRADLPNGARIRIYGADNPDSMRGIYLDGAVIDEPAQMKPAMWSEVLRPALADRGGWAVFIGTPKGRNWLYDVWRRAQKDPEWFTLMLKASETGILSADEIKSLSQDMSPAEVAQEFECSFDAPGIVQFIPQEVVDVARDRQPGRYGARVMGVDVARFGDDRTVLLVRKEAVEEIRVFRGIDTMQTAARAGEMAMECKPDAIFVDGVGVGGGVVDRLRALGFRVVDVNAGGRPEAAERYRNKRAEMWGRCREWLRDKGCIPRDLVHGNELADDLIAPQYEFDAQNRLLLESKEDMKKRGLPSPDIGDALALTFAEMIAPPEMRQVLWQTSAPDVDLFA
jgi:hypothetical protein